MTLLSLFGGLFGYNKAPKPPQHELSDISAVSISSGNMCRSYSYSFRIHKEDDIWFFDTECFTQEHEVETIFESCEINGEDIDALIKILEQNNSIAYAENYKKPKNSNYEVLDETMYGFCLAFSDSSQYITSDRQKELEVFFYNLAEKYSSIQAEQH